VADDPDHEQVAHDLDSIRDRLRDLNAELKGRKPVSDSDDATATDPTPRDEQPAE
jgi:hypothetical protein